MATGHAPSRTLPVFASGSSSGGGAASYRFYSSFKPAQFSVWSGILERQRYVCGTDTEGNPVAEPQPIDRNQGDDFGQHQGGNQDPKKEIPARPAETGKTIANQSR